MIVLGISIRVAAIKGSIALRGIIDFIPELFKIAGAIIFVILFGTIFIPALTELLSHSSEPESSNGYDDISAYQVYNSDTVQL